MQLYLSLSAYGGVTTREALTVFWNAGIRHVELAIGAKPDADAIQAIHDFKQQGITYRAHHAFVWGDRHRPFNLATSLDWNYFARLTDWLAQMEITAYSVHGGSFPTGSDRAVAYACFLSNVHRLYQLCQEREIFLGVETMYAAPPHSPTQNLLVNSSELTQFCRDLPEVKLVIDLAHLNIWHHHSLQEKLQWLELPSHQILEIHISDNDGWRDIHSRIIPKTWWVSIITLPTGVPVVLESRLNRLSASEVRQECDRVRELLVINCLSLNQMGQPRGDCPYTDLSDFD